MTAATPRLILGLFRPVDLARLFLVLVPCAPGLLFLLIAWLNDPPWRTPRPPAADENAHAWAAWQSHQLYLVGGIMVLAGTLGTLVVLWKIARTRPEEIDTDLASETGGDPGPEIVTTLATPANSATPATPATPDN